MLARAALFLALIQTPSTPQPTPPEAKPTVKITSPTLTGSPGQLITVTAQTSADTITWLGSEGVVFAHPYSVDGTAQTLAAKTMYCYVSLEDAQRLGTHFSVWATIPNGKLVVGDRATLDLGPPPPPPPPQPATFQDNLQAAFIADHATLDQTSKLAALYRVAATTTVQDATLKSTADLLAEMQRAVKNLGLPPGSLNNVARVIADELNKTLAANQPLTPALRTQIAKSFTAVNAALELLK